MISVAMQPALALACFVIRSYAQDLFLSPKALPALRSEKLAVAHDGWVFSIRNHDHPTLCLDVTGGSGDLGTPLEIWECNGQEGQLFFFDSGTFKIQWAGDASKCIDSGDMNDGTQLFLWDCSDFDQQHWGFDSDAGTIFLTASTSDASKCMDLTGGGTDGGTPVQVWDCDASLWSQQWSVMAGITIRTRENYQVCLDASGTDNGAALQLWECNGLSNQLWDFQGDSFQIRLAQDTSKCVDSGDMASNLFLWDCNGSDQQRFGYDADWGTLYLAASSDASKCADIPGGSLDWGTPIAIWDCNQCWNQGFTVIGPASSLTKASARLSSGVQDSCPPEPGPSPSPGPDCQAVGGWPKFEDYNQLNGDNWGRYFEAVYGEVPDSGYPICLSDFWVLYEQELQNSGAQVPAAASNCPRDGSANSKGDFYSTSQGAGLAPPNTKAIFQPPPFNALPDNTWIEVTHRAFPSDEHYGAWFYWAKGSGMWYNIGKTVVFQDHGDAFKHYGCALPDNEEMSQKCAAAGDDTIQFLNHNDGGTCGPCCQKLSGGVTWNYEFVACAMKGMYACAAASGDTTLKAGWMGKRDCECDENGLKVAGQKLHYLNCKGVPKR